MFRTFHIVVLLATLFVPGSVLGKSRPNILLLVAEDMSSKVGAFGDPVAVTPNIDQLAQQGVRYSNVYTTAPVCAPSRASLITGMHAPSIGAQHMRTNNFVEGSYLSVPPPDVKAFPELLRAAGYYTFTDSKLDYQFSEPGAGTGPFTIWDDEGRHTHWRNRPEGMPFFGMINFDATHEGGTFDPLVYWPGSLLHLGLQIYRRFTLGHIPERSPVRPQDIQLPPYYPDIPEVRRDMARHYNNIYAMDQQVGTLLAELERDELLNNTIVIWTTDHSDGLPRAKRDLYDSGIKVPMVIRWPTKLQPANLRPNDIDRRLISFVDLAPTILLMAGVDIPSFMSGRPIQCQTSRRYIYATRDRIDEVQDRQRAVRDKRFKYIRSWHPKLPGGHVLQFRDHQSMTRAMRKLFNEGRLTPEQARWFGPVGEEQLYDLALDPFEINNIASDSNYRETLNRMREAMQRWQTRIGDDDGVSERQMVSAMQCGGKQCKTEEPSARLANGTMIIEARSPGSSLGYSLNRGRWRLYSGPTKIPERADVAIKAVRYGWQESSVVSPSPTRSEEIHE